MTYEEYYGNRYCKMTETRDLLETLAESMKNGDVQGDEPQPVVYYCSRIKKPESMIRKLGERGFPLTVESALTNVYDAIGIRII